MTASDRLDDADRYAAATGAPIIEGGSRAYYEPAADIIHRPAHGQFAAPELFASARLHDPLDREARTSRP